MMDKDKVVPHARTDFGTQSTRIVLTSQNNAQVKELWAELSQQVMKKNENLYRRLANR